VSVILDNALDRQAKFPALFRPITPTHAFRLTKLSRFIPEGQGISDRDAHTLPKYYAI
jgi:hypothetical protein